MNICVCVCKGARSSLKQHLRVSHIRTHTHTYNHTRTHTRAHPHTQKYVHISMYMYICVCVCVCVCGTGSESSLGYYSCVLHTWTNKDTRFLCMCFSLFFSLSFLTGSTLDELLSDSLCPPPSPHLPLPSRLPCASGPLIPLLSLNLSFFPSLYPPPPPSHLLRSRSLVPCVSGPLIPLLLSAPCVWSRAATRKAFRPYR